MNRIITTGAGLALVVAPLLASTTATAHASDSASRQAPGYSVSARISKATAVAKEDTVKIRGSVRPGAAGDKVVLQQRLEGKKTWSQSGTAKVRANGTFLLKDEPSVAGTRFYRVLKPAAGKVAKGVSSELELTVYAWGPLASRQRGVAAGIINTTAMIGADNFANSLISTAPDAPNYVEYTLGKKCLKLRATYALTDSSATGGTGTVALKIDDRVAFASGLVLGQVIEDAETNVTDAFRIRYELASSGTPAANTAVATPEVLCTT
ncbi:hypothetical protein [Nocardioides currus]|uniref:Uncharacterized protein n=1 Tax=Nocardioides currus TaxID=2133958 RepID=A0A2R7YYF4_9ACTN|nr:hypothetical protein [Nocardioides currus]PUA81046.1 hypothetical protein C7S10_11760 [Nocardioides currus]